MSEKMGPLLGESKSGGQCFVNHTHCMSYLRRGEELGLHTGMRNCPLGSMCAPWLNQRDDEGCPLVLLSPGALSLCQ